MILVAAGTQDGRELIGKLLSAGYEVAASVVSEYGEKLLARYGSRLLINDEPLDTAGLVAYMKQQGITLLVDASHPYAMQVSQNAMQACRQLGLPYVRYERQSSRLEYDPLYMAASYEEAAEKAASLSQNVFLTTGSRNLHVFVEAPAMIDHRLTVRVLPTAEVVKECERLGLTPANIVALQGPFSTELNKELFRKYEAGVIVMKNSGHLGGTDTKLEAAMQLGLPVVVIERPGLAYDHLETTYEGILNFVHSHEALSNQVLSIH